MEDNKTLHWMHISDLHKGQPNTAQHWPLVRRQIFSDIERQIASHGLIDLVVFSGDLAYKGADNEFADVAADLVKMWDCFRQAGCNPVLLVVPGNHDLSRPAEDCVIRHVFPSIRDNAMARKTLLEKPDSIYRKQLWEIFENYERFLESLKELGLPVAMDCRGIFPGDVSHSFNVNGIGVGLVGLNSSWTQLSGDVEEGQLDICVEQLNALTGGDLPGWSESNDLNFLVTHHPVDWLNGDAQEDFNGAMFLPDYFDAHLYGHMHDNIPSQETLGAHSRRRFQAASLFGLELVAGADDRRHGYTFAKFSVDEEKCEIWPRRIARKINSAWEVEVEGSVIKGDAKSFVHDWALRKMAPSKKP